MAKTVPATSVRKSDSILEDGTAYRVLDGRRCISKMPDEDVDAHFDHQKKTDDFEELEQRELDYNFDYPIVFVAVSRDGELRQFQFSCSEEVRIV